MSSFVEFDNKRVELLANEPWQVREDPDSTIWLFKFYASAESGCCFLITDTVHVWGEALELRHLLRRHAKRHGARNEDDFQGHEDPEWQDARVKDLVQLHAQGTIASDSVEFSTERDTFNADLEVLIASSSYSWKWEAISLGAKLGPQILSHQLLLPLITFSEFALKAPQPLNQMDDASWTKQLDVTAKTGRVVNLTQVLFRKPRATSSFARISQTMNRVKTPTPVVTIYAEPSPLTADPQHLKGQHGALAARLLPGTDAPSESTPSPEEAGTRWRAPAEREQSMFEAPVPVGDENFLVHSTHENANDQLLSPIVGAQQPSTSQGRILDPSLTSVSQPLDRDEARTFPAPETLSGDEGSETDGEANEDSRFSPANPNRNPSSVNAQPHRSSDNSDSGTDSQPQPPKLKSKIAPKRKISSDDDEPNHSGTRTNPKPAHTGGTSWQGPRKTVVRKKKF